MTSQQVVRDKMRRHSSGAQTNRRSVGYPRTSSSQSSAARGLRFLPAGGLRRRGPSEPRKTRRDMLATSSSANLVVWSKMIDLLWGGGSALCAGLTTPHWPRPKVSIFGGVRRRASSASESHKQRATLATQGMSTILAFRYEVPAFKKITGAS